jgi:hypothetical protein
MHTHAVAGPDESSRMTTGRIWDIAASAGARSVVQRRL